MTSINLFEFVILIFFNFMIYCEGDWSPAGTKIKSRWASQIDANKVWPEYPRPQLVRENNWLNLNGLWDYAITADSVTEEPNKFDGQILVPFAVESSLSGVQKAVNADQSLWYRRHFKPLEKSANELYILHFGAVDYESHVFINGQSVGEHKGGYDSFSFDITKFINASLADQSIVLRVNDLTGGSQPTGKQRLKPEGTFYTATTGIWQTVWLERVPQHYITGLKITPDVDSKSVEIVINTNSPNNVSMIAELKILDTDMKIVAANEKWAINSVGLKESIPNVVLWSNTNPHLYTIQIKLGSDSISSYFGMRKIEVKKDAKGINRFFLNNNPVFMFGPLEQGYWPDGVYLPPNDAALKFDLEFLQNIGFNAIRKHVKVELERYYYWADKMGFLVWQDFPSAFGNLIDHNPDPLRTDSDAKQIETEMQRMVSQLYNHPSIVMWIPFNEGWGQYDTPRIVGLFKEWDKTRLVNEASGWNDRNASDIEDRHHYPGANEIPLNPNRVVITGEYGGGTLMVKDHLWDATQTYGYKVLNNSAELQKFFIDRLATIRINAIFGLGAAIYTQNNDQEVEINGLITYDRAEVKVSNLSEVKQYVDKLYPSESVSSILLHAGHISDNQEWHYITKEPTGNWTSSTFNDTNWSKGKSGFGKSGTPAITIRTNWDTADIWLRKEFDVSTGKLPKHPVLHIFYDDYANVFINGVEIEANLLNPYQIGYAAFDIPTNVFKEGKNIIAIYCHNIELGQGIDAGIIDICYDNCA